MAATCSSMTFVIVHVGSSAGDVVEEVLEHRLAVLGVEHLGVELHAGHAAGRRSSKAATAAPAERAVTSNPSGAADTESPWLIHTDCSVGQAAEQRRRPGAVTVSGGAPELGQPGALDRAAEGLSAMAWKP